MVAPGAIVGFARRWFEAVGDTIQCEIVKNRTVIKQMAPLDVQAATGNRIVAVSNKRREFGDAALAGMTGFFMLLRYP